MKYCKNCGAAIDENAIFCPRCGLRTNGDAPKVNFENFGFNPYTQYAYQPVDNEPSKIIAILAFMFWWVGLAIWLFCRRSRPGKARSALKGLLSSACFTLPVLGAVMWALWKGDVEKDSYAQVAKYSAIAGVIFYAVWALLSVVAVLSGATEAGWYMDMSQYLGAAISPR